MLLLQLPAAAEETDYKNDHKCRRYNLVDSTTDRHTPMQQLCLSVALNASGTGPSTSQLSRCPPVVIV